MSKRTRRRKEKVVVTPDQRDRLEALLTAFTLMSYAPYVTPKELETLDRMMLFHARLLELTEAQYREFVQNHIEALARRSRGQHEKVYTPPQVDSDESAVANQGPLEFNL